jgi:hypothetical protein
MFFVKEYGKYGNKQWIREMDGSSKPRSQQLIGDKQGKIHPHIAYYSTEYKHQ